MSWHQSTLGEECELYQPQTLAKNELDNSGVYKVYGANGVIGTHSKYNHEDPQVLVTCRGATCGTINISEAKSWINGNAMVVKPRSSNIDLYFLSHYLHHLDMSKAITGAAQPQITRQSLAPIKIQFPPLAEQQRIASILDKAAEIKAKREQAIAKLDKLGQSMFVEMFGNPLENTKGHKCGELGAGILLTGGGAFKSSDFIEVGIPLIRIAEVNRKNFGSDSLPCLPEEYEKKFSRFIVKNGDLLMSLTGTTGKDDYGNVIMVRGVRDRYFLNQRVALIKPKENIFNVEYLFYLLRNDDLKNALISKSRGVRQANISNGDITGLVVPFPPIARQVAFKNAVNKLEMLIKEANDGLVVSKHLIASLQHKAFTTGFAA